MRSMKIPTRPAALLSYGVICFTVCFVVGLLAVADFRIVTAADHAVSGHIEAGLPTEHWMMTMERITALGDFNKLTVIACVAVGFFFFLRRWIAASTVALGFLVNPYLTDIAKSYFQRPRPGIFGSLDSYSYPSGHTTCATVFFLLVGWGLAGLCKRRALRIGCVAICALVPVLVGFSRIYFDVHWLSDVYGGLFFGAAQVFVLIGFTRLDFTIVRPAEKEFSRTPL
jgi:membrane-associated phospholipid phosphatase